MPSHPSSTVNRFNYQEMTEAAIIKSLRSLEAGRKLVLHNDPHAPVESVMGTLFNKTGDHVDQCYAAGLRSAKSGVSRCVLKLTCSYDQRAKTDLDVTDLKATNADGSLKCPPRNADADFELIERARTGVRGSVKALKAAGLDIVTVESCLTTSLTFGLCCLSSHNST